MASAAVFPNFICKNGYGSGRRFPDVAGRGFSDVFFFEWFGPLFVLKKFL